MAWMCCILEDIREDNLLVMAFVFVCNVQSCMWKVVTATSWLHFSPWKIEAMVSAAMKTQNKMPGPSRKEEEESNQKNAGRHCHQCFTSRKGHLFLLHTAPCWESAELPLKAISSVELSETVESMMVWDAPHIHLTYTSFKYIITGILYFLVDLAKRARITFLNTPFVVSFPTILEQIPQSLNQLSS